MNLKRINHSEFGQEYINQDRIEKFEWRYRRVDEGWEFRVWLTLAGREPEMQVGDRAKKVFKALLGDDAPPPPSRLPPAEFHTDPTLASNGIPDAK